MKFSKTVCQRDQKGKRTVFRDVQNNPSSRRWKNCPCNYRIPDRRSVAVKLNYSWLFPYGPVLSNMFQCHMSFELSISRVDGIKHLSKYVCKGPDQVTALIKGGQKRYHEISAFEKARYVSTSEAVWRLFQFDIIYRSPPVLRVDVHFEHHYTVHFQENNEQAAFSR